MISRANTGVYQRHCARCGRDSSLRVRTAIEQEDFIVAEVECEVCGVDSVSIIGERGPRAKALLLSLTTKKATFGWRDPREGAIR